MKRLFIVLCLSIVSAGLFAATYYSRNGGGDWDSRFSWTLNSSGTGAPAANAPLRTDNVIILSGHTINITANNDNGSAGISPNGLNLPNVGAFTTSGTACFYQTGNITVNSGGSLVATTRVMISGFTLVDGSFSATGDIVNLGNLVVTSTANLTTNDDLILSGTSRTILNNATNSFDDIYIDHTEARLCGSGVMNIGVSVGNTPNIQYFNGATVAQICLGFTVTCGPDPACAPGFPVAGTGGFSFDLSGYDYYKYITIRSDKVPGDLTNFPVLISLTDPDIRTVADGGRVQNANGYDVIFSSSNNCGALSQLDHQVISYSSNTTTATILAWVKVPALSSSTDTEIFMYYGNDSITTDLSLSSTFDYNFSNIYHFQNGSFNDASAYGNNGTNNGTANLASSIVGNGRTFDAGDYISMPTADMLIGSGTLSAWIYSTSFTGNHHYIFGHTTVPSYNNRLQVYTNDAGGNLDLGLGNNHNLSTGIYDFNLTEWYHVALTWAAGTYNVYVNGQSEASGAYAAFTALQTFIDIGNNGLASSRAEHWIGDIDEVRASNIVRSANWIETEYNNQVLPDSFFTVGIEIENICIALPIVLSEFRVYLSEENQVIVNWTTLSEINNDFFTIERSKDAKKWEVVSIVPGAGNSRIELKYNDIDRDPYDGRSYYRLKQTDYDGQFKYSKIATVNRNDQWEYSVNPNPTKNSVLFSAGEELVKERIEIRDILGRLVGAEITEMGNSVQIDLQELENGLYFLRYQKENEILVFKILKE